MRDTSWAYALKPGDKALIRTLNPYTHPYDILTFSRATATQLIFDAGTVRERRVRKDTLWVMGSGSYKTIEPCTPEALDANTRYTLVRDLSNIKAHELKNVPTHVLAEFHTIVYLAKIGVPA